MFGMNGFHVSASGAIQGHHGPLVFFFFFFFLSRLVLCQNHNLVISSPIDLKLGNCVCCNNTECSVKVILLYFILSMSYFPLIVFFTAFSAHLEYNFVIYRLSIFKIDMYDCEKLWSVVHKNHFSSQHKYWVIPPLTFIFIAFLALWSLTLSSYVGTTWNLVCLFSAIFGSAVHKSCNSSSCCLWSPWGPGAFYCIE